MSIDFSPLLNRTVTAEEFSKNLTQEDLRSSANEFLDLLVDIVKDKTDAQLSLVPFDPEANDPDAKTEDEKHIGWSLAHLVLHVTASAEEGAAFASLLARGVELPAGTRLRYEPGWRDVTTKVQVEQRLAECRRMLMAYLDTWPDEPHLDTLRKFAENSPLAAMKINAVASFVFGLSHLARHIDQIKFVAAQVEGKAAATNT